MTIEAVIINEPIIKPIELKNIGFLEKESTFITCPSCNAKAMSLVHLETVTCLQRLLELTKIWYNYEYFYKRKQMNSSFQKRKLNCILVVVDYHEALNTNKKWERRYDINHYCRKCGCYIGRYVPICCGERCISRSARKKAAYGEMCLKTKQRDCCANVQKIREQVKAKRAAKKTEKESKIETK